ncbi:hypothetical protein RD055328_05960 [Companilactobacillus sp. RD055328]|uniref:hypothetical protein n=1 Tax=Companilactobacillus sp. RD055328 TaxID=2916634 RepID=UPI001FC8C41A|nr:hypothetical protein [Companilactobacillus sp. RD055328]GKQ42673.1 hypothetical protein RD055328_05960 [Companilactobacillus sp. RD055328]
MKRNILITILMTLLLLAAGVIVSKHDSVKYKSVMNRNGVTEDAFILKANSNKKIVTALKEVSKHEKLKFRMHFIDKKDADKSYFYGQNEKISLPIKTGRSFSNLDFSAAVPFVIVGKDVKDVIKPQEQRYIKQSDNYLPVIGITEMDDNSNLNNHIFTSISPNITDNDAKIADYRIILDGVYTHKKETVSLIKKEFKAKKVGTSTNKINNIKQKTIEKNYVLFIILSLITVILIVLNFNLIIPMKYSINNSQLDGDLQKDFKFGFIFQFIIYNAIAFIISYTIISNWILIINYTPITIFYVANIILTIILGSYVIFTKNRSFLR